MSNAKYLVNEEKRTCVCLIRIPFSDYTKLHGTFKGIAKCSPNDKFDTTVGCDIAYARALLSLKKAEVKFHTKEMEYYKKHHTIYEQHLKALEFNLRRVNEVEEELKDLLSE